MAGEVEQECSGRTGQVEGRREENALGPFSPR